MFEFEVIQEHIHTILEYKVNEIINRNFYIKEYKQKYNLKEIKQILIKF